MNNQTNTVDQNALNQEMMFDLQKKKTNHILHLILSVITVGVWLLPWILIAQHNGAKNKRLKTKITGKKDWMDKLGGFLVKGSLGFVFVICTLSFLLRM